MIAPDGVNVQTERFEIAVYVVVFFEDFGVVDTHIAFGRQHLLQVERGARLRIDVERDFRRFYLIADRQGARVLRDPFSAKPYVLFYTTKRVGGGVQNFDAVKVMVF